jgi:hypothetical protein
MTVAGLVPMHTPDEALREIDELSRYGFKVAVMPEGVWRPIASPDPDSSNVWLMPGQSYWFDTYGLDSEYDYDPVWQSLIAKGMSITFHSNAGSVAPFTRTSISNMCHNHLGSHEHRMKPVVKSLFFGGVTRRMPDFRCAFLECGVGWVPGTFAAIVELWERRNVSTLKSTLDPALIDFNVFEEQVRSHQPEWVSSCGDELSEMIRRHPNAGSAPDQLDDWAALEIVQKSDLEHLFVDRFYFGCEADDATVPFAFSKVNKFGARFRAIFSSDLGHWDVPDMKSVVPEAWKFVERGHLSELEFRQFTCTNALEFFTANRHDFFEDTAVSSAAESYLDESHGRAPA